MVNLNQPSQQPIRGRMRRDSARKAVGCVAVVPVTGSCLWTLPFLPVSGVERGPDTGHSKVCKSPILETVHNHETRLLHTFIEDKSCVYTARGYTKHLQMTSITRAVKTRVADSVTQQHINILPPSHPPDRMADHWTAARCWELRVTSNQF